MKIVNYTIFDKICKYVFGITDRVVKINGESFFIKDNRINYRRNLSCESKKFKDYMDNANLPDKSDPMYISKIHELVVKYSDELDDLRIIKVIRWG